ncbi:MAG TPA: LuxR family transcriptional regulator [Gallionella sp.]|nr:LuxR family transcriptional regulator [Gallionella sp.]
MKSIEKFADLASYASVGSWRDRIFSLGKDLGYKHTLLAIFPSHDTPMEAEHAFLHSNYSPTWRKKYDDEKMGHIDPVATHCIEKSTPLIWSPEVFASCRQKEMYEEACSYGIRSGVSLPMHGCNGEFGVVCFVSDTNPGQRARKDILHSLPELSCFRDFIFETSRRFIKPALEPDEKVNLTRRELECLKWSTSGKSSWEIARILRCSEATVNFHFANIRRKFGTTTRRHAEAKAIRLGIVDPT